MKRIHVVLLLAAGILLAGTLAFAALNDETAPGPLTRKGILQRYGFIDEDGDGINDLARDSDNDGIPNCVDPDWARPQDGTGFMNRHGYKHQHANQNALQANGGCLNFHFNYNYHYNHQWLHSGSGGNVPGGGDPTNPDPNPNRNRRTNRKR